MDPDTEIEFGLRPLRIQKRNSDKEKERKEKEREDKDNVEWGLEERNDDTQTQPSDETNDFVCRPMRLGSYKKRLLLVLIKNLPIEEKPKKTAPSQDTIFAVCLVDFHHARGPEVQWWRSNYSPAVFANLPFQALPDGSHLFEETFSNFNLVYDFESGTALEGEAIERFTGNPNKLETLFGCSCVRQVKTLDLDEGEVERNKDITRLMVQKAVVVISRHQPVFVRIKEKLLIVTHSYFQQLSFNNVELLETLFDNLNAASLEPASEHIEEFYVNLNLRHMLLLFKLQVLVILKALLLEKKVLIYSSSNLELLTQFQNNLIALVPGLLNDLQLLGSPLSDYSEKHAPLSKPTLLKSHDRESMLRFCGLPLQIFNTKGSFWNPYLPLQQLEELHAQTFMVGCSNLLIYNQAAHYKIDVVVNLDTNQVTYPLGCPEELQLSSSDKRFVQHLVGSSQTEGDYVGSDDYIRHQFEDYVRSLVVCTRYQQYIDRWGATPPGFDDPPALKSFGSAFVAAWMTTKNYGIWNATCDEFIFNFHEPVHMAAAEPTWSSFFKLDKIQEKVDTAADKGWWWS